MPDDPADFDYITEIRVDHDALPQDIMLLENTHDVEQRTAVSVIEHLILGQAEAVAPDFTQTEGVLREITHA